MWFIPDIGFNRFSGLFVILVQSYRVLVLHHIFYLMQLKNAELPGMDHNIKIAQNSSSAAFDKKKKSITTSQNCVGNLQANFGSSVLNSATNESTFASFHAIFQIWRCN